jgi:hypothetical protein
MNHETCHEHSGCLTDIKNLKQEAIDQWGTMAELRTRVDGIMTRLNILLGAVLVAVITAIINLVTK